uniref:G005_VD_Con-ikot-ikot_precursor_conopeptide n=1 Tax=Conus geographus TaxID=6491 RepID=X5IFV6_CONGE|nr:G005_VD_Con-ikot-ikot_precursor_conopeptide [Conus geographus]
MAMSMSMTLSVFVMVVMAATVTGFTQLKKPDLSRMKRNNKVCCTNAIYQCLKRNPGQESYYAHPCQQEAVTSCPGSDIDGCCPGYTMCMSTNAQNNVHTAHTSCLNRPCFGPCK